MRFVSAHVMLLLLAVAFAATCTGVEAKKPSRSSTQSRGPSRSSPRSSSSGRPAVSKRRYSEEEEDEEFGFPDEDLEEEEEYDEEFDDEEEEVVRPSSSRRPAPSKRGSSSSSRSAPKKSSHRSSRSRYEDDYEEDYDRRRRPSSGQRGPSRRGPPPSRRSGGRVVPYGRAPEPSSFVKGINALRSSMPDPTAVRDAAVNSFGAAREATSNLSANLYREVKGLTSSELEQVMLKATRPDDTAVKGKHAERLVAVTYQISSRYDLYDAVLRKLWAKMAEKDWRTTIKALYILHRFSADGAPDHAAALKARLRELRRTKDPKRKDKYFNSKQLLAGDNKPENAPFHAFMSRYAHYVLLRAQCFGGMFDEISSGPDAASKDKKAKKKSGPKPITSTALRAEHLEAATLLLNAGLACQLREGEPCENTALAVERVASDLIGLSAAVATALNRALKGDDLKGADPALIKRWCVFYSQELQPKTRSMVKKTTPKLDAFGLFLPARMGTQLSPDTLQKGLQLDEDSSTAAVEEEETKEEEGETKAETVQEEEAEEAVEQKEEEAFDENEGDEYDEYEYEEEDYYDDENEA